MDADAILQERLAVCGILKKRLGDFDAFAKAIQAYLESA